LHVCNHNVLLGNRTVHIATFELLIVKGQEFKERKRVVCGM